MTSGRLKHHRLLATAAFASMIAACGGGSDPNTATFAFRLHSQTGQEEFYYRTSSPRFIELARAQLQLPAAQRSLFPSGPIERGNGGYNQPWQWHFTEAELVDAAIELCDGGPAMIDADPAYWLDRVRLFCPWNGYVYAER